MTKKSAARLQRDAQAAAAARIVKDARAAGGKNGPKENTIWDDLNGTYSACAQALGQHAGIALMLNRKEVFPFLKDPHTLAQNISALSNDLRALNQELKEIKAQHADKTGGTLDPDEVIRSIQIFEQYNLFLERHQAVIMPVAMHILEEFGAAEVAFNQAVATPSIQEQAQDVTNNQPIDVPFKEVQSDTQASAQ